MEVGLDFGLDEEDCQTWMDLNGVAADWFLTACWKLWCWRVVIGSRSFEFFT